MTSLPAQPDFAPADSPNPRVLVADDDPASRQFLCDGLRSLGADAQGCADGLIALERLHAGTFDLLLLDCRMPGAGALRILTLLREATPTRAIDSIAVATTAELEPGDRQRLVDAGFSEILIKPCGLADLQRVLTLAQPDRHDACVLDDRSAMITTGDTTTMRALRLLLREELAILHQELDALSRDPTDFSERLHRLRSACGFCGATTLSAQTILLQQQLLQHDVTPIAVARFRKALLTTLQALDR
ncbi:response regulator [Rhodanobacter sp. Col0626]|uniref:response regulator n=1 Tax=Rhodanobacter sp. Col0626 TaxID=3415679 RepID=UPI003CF2A74C